MTTPMQLALIAFGVIFAIHSISKGLAIGSLPAGWMIAEDANSSEATLYIWLGACLVWGFSLVFLLKVKDARNNPKLS